MKVKALLGTIFLLTTLSASAPAFTFIASFNTKAGFVVVDNFSNFYTADANRLTKFSPDGKFLYPYEELRYGKIGMVDVNNPLKIYVYYPDFSTVITLDRFLAPLNTYNFFELGYQNITAVGSSVDGRIWFYDNLDFKLKKIDETGKVYRESQPLNVILEETPTPNFLCERDGKVYMNDPQIGILVFDVFGSYAKTIPLKGLNKFQVLQEQIVYFDNYRLSSYNPITFENKSITLPDTTDLVQAVLEKDRLAILKKDRIDFYRY
ncbi:MAG: hypothetical protein U0V74_10115 [Chitinophagales bacterium]